MSRGAPPAMLPPSPRPPAPLSPAAREAAVLFALAPLAALQAAWLGMGVLLGCALAAAAALGAELALSGLRGERGDAFGRLAAIGAGTLLGLGLPHDAPAWLPLLGGGLAGALGRHVLRGAPLHPSMAALLVIAALAPSAMAASDPMTAPAGPWALGAALAGLAGMAGLAWRGIARGAPLLAALAGATLALGALAATGHAIPAAALPALVLGAGMGALRGPWSAATPAARVIAGGALGLASAPLACAWPGLVGVAIALVAVGALAPALDAAPARRAPTQPGGPRTGAQVAPDIAHAAIAARVRTPAAGAALGGLLAACLLALAALEALLR